MVYLTADREPCSKRRRRRGVGCAVSWVRVPAVAFGVCVSVLGGCLKGLNHKTADGLQVCQQVEQRGIAVAGSNPALQNNV